MMEKMIYRKQIKVPSIHYCNDDFRNQLDALDDKEIIVVTDPPFNIGYHYNEYKDSMNDEEYFAMLTDLIRRFPSVIIHYPEALHKLSMLSGKIPDKVCSWVYNSNTARQHRDIAWYKVKPDFTKTLQPYKNLNDKRIKERMARGIRGGAHV
jgi:hypothetical protein